MVRLVDPQLVVDEVVDVHFAPLNVPDEVREPSVAGVRVDRGV